MPVVDKELEEYRSLMEVPGTFENGFTLSSVVGAVFLALVMVPGSLYMELLAGMGVGPAAQWVTVILFVEVAKRANARMSRAQIFILFYISGAIVGQYVHGTPLFRQFLVRSEAAVSAGISTMFPAWVAPAAGSDAWNLRSFFQLAWLPAIGLIAFQQFFGKLNNAVLSYGLFRRVSDVERLPFPMAPVAAQGVVAMAEEMEERPEQAASWRWRAFSIGGAIGMVSGLLYMGVPTISSAFFGEPIKLFPIPFVDLTPYTQHWLPASATGITFDLGQFVIGMVLPFFAVLGSFLGALFVLLLNPVLYNCDLLPSWSFNQGTVRTLFSNNVDFYFSTTIGLSLAVAVIGFWSLLKSLFAARRKDREDLAAPGDDKASARRRQRGDIPDYLILLAYLVSTACYILLSGYLIGWHLGVMLVLFFFAYIYTPIISYVTARLEGMAGQMIEIPFIREISFILSGYKGVAIWFLPIPRANYGRRTVMYRQAELTGTRFSSIWKADALLFPIVLVSMICFSSFIWSMDDVPSAVYPYTQEIWNFEAKNTCLIYSSTLGEYSEFQDALSPVRIGLGFVFGMVVFGGLSFFNAPVMLFYGLVRGMSGLMIHMLIPQFLGGVAGRYYFRRKFGESWRKYITVVSAGFFCGAGLVTMFCIGIKFLVGATSPLPY